MVVAWILWGCWWSQDLLDIACLGAGSPPPKSTAQVQIVRIVTEHAQKLTSLVAQNDWHEKWIHKPPQYKNTVCRQPPFDDVSTNFL